MSKSSAAEVSEGSAGVRGLLLKRIQKSNAKKHGYIIGSGYNSSWSKMAETLKNEGRIGPRRDGFWLLK
jgi:hypothetical protein